MTRLSRMLLILLLSVTTTAVFTGLLVKRDESGGSAVVTFDVAAVYKGEVVRLQQVETAADSATCGLSLPGPGPHLVFARTASEPAADGIPLRADLCGGSRPLSDGEPDAGLGTPRTPTAGTAATPTAFAGIRRPPIDAPGWPTAAAIGAGATAVAIPGLLLWRRWGHHPG
ncbi:MAG: hypothetical protein ACR2JK_03000 [Geodermatophilaceae bacterium]